MPVITDSQTGHLKRTNILSLNPAQVDRLCELHREGKTMGAIAAAMGLSSRSAVSGHISRLRAAGDPRIGPPRVSPIGERAVDRLCDLLADGATLASAARQLHWSRDYVYELWAKVRSDLGPQAI